MHQQSLNKCVEVTHWLKNMFVLEFSIFLGGFKCYRFAVEVGSMGVKLPLC